MTNKQRDAVFDVLWAVFAAVIAGAIGFALYELAQWVADKVGLP